MKIASDNDYYEFMEIPARPKPRHVGLTSLSDYFLSLRETEDVLEVASDAVDYAKMADAGMVSTVPTGWVRDKIALWRKAGIKTYPGGIPFQLAYMQDKVEKYFDWLSDNGFDGVEIADDALPANIAPEKWFAAIESARSRGLFVITEHGKKDPKQPLDLKKAEKIIKDEIALGVIHSTIERSELKFYIDRDPTPLLEFVSAVGNKYILFEAGPYGFPHVHAWLFKNFGLDVNLGNIGKAELLWVEWLRRGLGRLNDGDIDYSYFFDKANMKLASTPTRSNR